MMPGREWDPELHKCKALSMDPENVVVGYIDCNSNETRIWVDEFDSDCGASYMNLTHVNPYTVCRNTGIKTKQGYLYEYDLILFGTAITQQRMGYIEWSDFESSYVIKTSLNYTSTIKVQGRQIEIIGNIMLSAVDQMKMQDYSDKEDGIASSASPECRSQQHMNKLAKQHLPR